MLKQMTLSLLLISSVIGFTACNEESENKTPISSEKFVGVWRSTFNNSEGTPVNGNELITINESLEIKQEYFDSQKNEVSTIVYGNLRLTSENSANLVLAQSLIDQARADGYREEEIQEQLSKPIQLAIDEAGFLAIGNSTEMKFAKVTVDEANQVRTKWSSDIELLSSQVALVSSLVGKTLELVSISTSFETEGKEPYNNLETVDKIENSHMEEYADKAVEIQNPKKIKILSDSSAIVNDVQETSFSYMLNNEQKPEVRLFQKYDETAFRSILDGELTINQDNQTATFTSIYHYKSSDNSVDTYTKIHLYNIK